MTMKRFNRGYIIFSTLVLLGWWVFLAEAADNHGLNPPQEQEARDRDARLPSISSGCAPSGFSVLTITAFACDGYVVLGQRLPFVRQATAAGVTLPAVNGDYYVLLFHDTTALPAGWSGPDAGSTFIGSHYRQQRAATQPADPDGGMVFLKAIVAGGVITSLVDLRNVSAHQQGRYDVMSTAFGGIPNDGTDQSGAIQAAIEAACSNLGGTVYLGKGQWVITSEVNIASVATNACRGLILEGAGSDATEIFVSGAIRGLVYDPPVATIVEARLTIRHLKIKGTTADTLNLLTINNASTVTLANLFLRDGSTNCLSVDNSFKWSLKDSRLQDCAGDLVEANPVSNVFSINNVDFNANTTGTNHISITASGPGSITNNNFEGLAITNVSIQFDGVTGVDVEANFFEMGIGPVIRAAGVLSTAVTMRNNVWSSDNSTVIDFATGNLAHTDIEIQYNRFSVADGRSMFNPGTGILSYKFCNNNANVTPSAWVVGFPNTVECVDIGQNKVEQRGPLTRNDSIPRWQYDGQIAIGPDNIVNFSRSGEDLSVTTGATGTILLRSAGSDRFIVQSNGRLSWGTLVTAPAVCAIGDTYFDTSGAFCACSSTDTWTNTHGVGTCI